jgi:GNAT superfamily N-acetyltransferase
LAAQHGELVAQDEDLQVLSGLATGEQGEQLDGAAQCQVGKSRPSTGCSQRGSRSATIRTHASPESPAYGTRPSLRTPQLPRLPEALVRLLVEVDGCRHVALVAEVGGETAGIARFVALPDQTGTAEVAVTVADRFQGRGIGGLLLDALGRAAVGVGMDLLVYLVDPTNRPMLRLLRRLGVELRYRDGLVEGRQPLAGQPAATA